MHFRLSFLWQTGIVKQNGCKYYPVSLKGWYCFDIAKAPYFFMLILGLVRLSKGQKYPAELGMVACSG